MENNEMTTPLSHEEVVTEIKEAARRAHTAISQATDHRRSLAIRLKNLGYPPDERLYLCDLYDEYVKLINKDRFDADKALDLLSALAAIGMQVDYSEIYDEDATLPWEPDSA